MLDEKTKSGRAVVIGAGVMGAGIAALLANVGWHVDLLDRATEGDRSRLAREGLDRVLKSRPPQFAIPENAQRVQIGNIEDDVACLSRADWIVEAAAEDIEVKKHIFALVCQHAGPDAIISSNTSGLSLSGMVADCPESIRRRFLGTHFFNPPRYMKPLELITTSETLPEVFNGFAAFAERVLGKRIVRAKDTPGFISTRLGMYALTKTLGLALKHGLTPEEADYLTGPLLGRPKSGTFRLADIVGLDITAKIAANLRSALPEDAAYQALEVPGSMQRLIADGRLGGKTGAGFYKRDASGAILTLDPDTLEYRESQKPEPVPADIERLPFRERIAALWNMENQRYQAFLREMLTGTLSYMANVTTEVSDRIVEVDDALIGGFGWEVGPFHLLDMLPDIKWGSSEPALVQMLHAAGEQRFYFNKNGEHFYFDYLSGAMNPLPRPGEVLFIKDLKKAGKVVEDLGEASLIDFGEDVLCLEWHTKMGTLNPAITRALNAARERTERDFTALVIAGNGDPFSVGFDLSLLSRLMEEKRWEEIDGIMNALQQALQRIKYGIKPVVCAVSGFTLGGGCEVMLHCSVVQAAFESSIGLPEANAGLIPTGGGIAQSLIRAMSSESIDPFPKIKPVWERLRTARFSSSAPEAESLGYLRSLDRVTMHPDRLLYDARQLALSLSYEYAPPENRSVRVLGQEGLARVRWELHNLFRAGRLTAHDVRVAIALASVLCGGKLTHPAEVSEQYILNVEREEFLSLAGTPESLARIKHLLATGKPLRN